jgi:glycosyltransferase involved in cell wall biosynthesis
MPFHSILISAYNRFSYLKATVESCLASSDSDFEILIVDDASNRSEADSFYHCISSLDPRIRVIRHSVNMGVGTRFAELHRESRGKLLHLIGSDDLCHPHRLRTSREVMGSLDSYNAVLCGLAKQLRADYQTLSQDTVYRSPCAIKAAMFFQPMVLHPTVTSWHPDISELHQYRDGMRAAVDYCYYVDNYFNSYFRSMERVLVYLVHSSTGITRDSSSRCNQLAMHDYAMHRLWSSFVDCSISDISAIRSIVVSREYPQVDIERYGRRETQQLIEMVLSAKNMILSSCLVKCKNERFSGFIRTEDEKTEFTHSIRKYFDVAERALVMHRDRTV